MQAFGKFASKFDTEYLIEHYIYFEQDGKTVDTDELEKLIKNRRKTVAGTIFMYNPHIVPKGYSLTKKLSEQDFEFDDEFHELNFDDSCGLFSSALKDEYVGKLVEIKYLFNINKANIQPTQALEAFDSDLDRYYSSQLTQYAKELNYQDYKNIRLSGKFVFFGWGHKYDRHHNNIYMYAKNIAEQVQKLGKHIAFIYDKNLHEPQSLKVAYFISPLGAGKQKVPLINAFKNAFSTNPPTSQRLG